MHLSTKFWRLAAQDGPRTAAPGNRWEPESATKQPGSARAGTGPGSSFASGHFGSQQQQSGDRWAAGGGGPNGPGPRGGSIEGGGMGPRRGWRDEERAVPNRRDGPVNPRSAPATY